jgi:hypothetical protein
VVTSRPPAAYCCHLPTLREQPTSSVVINSPNQQVGALPLAWRRYMTGGYQQQQGVRALGT